MCSTLSSGKNKGAESVVFVFVFLQFSSFKKSVSATGSFYEENFINGQIIRMNNNHHFEMFYRVWLHSF